MVRKIKYLIFFIAMFVSAPIVFIIAGIADVAGIIRSICVGINTAYSTFIDYGNTRWGNKK